jgi:predicted dinucleotide-binding enzyme
MGPSEWLLARPGSTKQAGDLNGKLLISCCTPLNEGFSGLIIGTNDSGVETIQRMAPRANAVEAFNSVFATTLESGDTRFGDRRTQVIYCSNNQEAKKVVARLIAEIDCEGVHAGPLSSARYMEPMGAMLVRLGLAMGRGTNLHLNFLHR